MAFTSKSNRRFVDSAQRKAEVTDAVKVHGSRLMRVLGLLGLTLGLAWGAYAGHRWALTSSTFGLRKTSFTGNARASRNELLKLSGLSAGQNLFALDVGALERALLAHPWVRKVSVSRRFPSTLSFEVVEHVPVAMVSLGDLYLVDEEGEPFKRLVVGDGVDLPLLAGIDREHYMQDEAGTRARFQAALEMARAYAATKPGRRERLSELRIDDAGYSLLTASGQQVRLGEGDATVKLERMVRVRRELETRGLTAEIIHLDNRARPGWVAVKLSSAVSERNGTSTQ